MLGSTAWAQINTVSLAAGQVNSDKTLHYFNIYGHKCVDLHSFTLPCNFHDCNYNTKRRPNAIHVLFTQHAAHDTGPKEGYAMRVSAMLPTHKLQCYQHTNLLALAQPLLTVTPIKQALWVVALHVTFTVHEHLPAADGCRAVAPRIDTQRTVIAIKIACI